MGFVSQLFFGKAPFFCVRKFVVVLAVGKKRLLFLGHDQMRVAKLIVGLYQPCQSLFCWFTLVQLGSLVFTWVHMGSLGFFWVCLGFLEFNLVHLGSFWFTLDHFSSHGFTYFYLGLLGLFLGLP